MNYLLLSADRTTHLKILGVAIVAATVVLAVGVNARVTETGTTTAQWDGPVIKARVSTVHSSAALSVAR